MNGRRASPVARIVSSTLLLLGVLFGSLGLGYCVYGRRQQALVPFLAGLALIALPYLITNVAGLIATGVVLAALPFVVRL
ncbi:MAG: hypothetical protein LKCHEGNO_02967 [Burkholderiaceae bacterium]|nr:hypothetical protein [Burkholderiaceae bacterium]